MMSCGYAVPGQRLHPSVRSLSRSRSVTPNGTASALGSEAGSECGPASASASEFESGSESELVSALAPECQSGSECAPQPGSGHWSASESVARSESVSASGSEWGLNVGLHQRA